MRFMTFVRMTEDFPTAPAALSEAIERLAQEAGAAGILLERGGLLPSQFGARVELRGGRVAVHDGPFTESEELIGGWTSYELHSLAEAKEWARRSLQVTAEYWPGVEAAVEIRQTAGFSGSAS